MFKINMICVVSRNKKAPRVSNVLMQYLNRLMNYSGEQGILQQVEEMERRGGMEGRDVPSKFWILVNIKKSTTISHTLGDKTYNLPIITIYMKPFDAKRNCVYRLT